MNGIDQISAEGQMYDILAPEVVNDYVEKVGKPCQNPYGYSAGSLMLAKDTEGVQRLYKVTQAINNGQDILEGTNCEKRKLGECFDDVDNEIDSVKQALTNETNARLANGAHNMLPYPFATGTSVRAGVSFAVNAETQKITASDTSTGGGDFHFYNGKNFLPIGTYRLKFDGTASNVTFRVYDSTSGSVLASIANTEDSATFSITSSNVDHNIIVYLYWVGIIAVAVNGGLLICDNNDPSNVHTPYAMTNRELTDRLSGNVLGTSTSLTDNTDFTCPADGYFRIYCNNTAGSYCYGYINSLHMMTVSTPSNAATEGVWYSSMFVKKGMKIRHHGTANNSTGVFIPIQN